MMCKDFTHHVSPNKLITALLTDYEDDLIMAKRRSTRPTLEEQHAALLKRRALLLKLVWGALILICILFGYSRGYPIAVEGDLIRGVLVGVAYGGGAFILVLGALFLNRKLKGL
jgi:hypothetical protein